MLDLDPLTLLSHDALVPVTFPHGGTGLAPVLDPGTGSRNLAHGAQCSLPLWILKSMHYRNMVTLKLPAVYTERYRRKLNAGAECMSFKNLSPNFYEVGNKLNEMMLDVDLAVWLARTFKTRYHELVSRGLNSMTGEDVLKLSSKLCTEEQQLFEGGRISILAVDHWWRGEGPASQRKPGQHPIFKRILQEREQNQREQEANKQQRRA